MSEARGSRTRRVAMRDVAQLAGVSLGTVSRVINRNQSVRSDIRDRVRQAMEQLGYVPDAVAAAMRSQSTMVIGYMVPDISNSLFAAAVGGAERVLNEAAYTLILSSSHYSAEREKEILSLFRRRRLDGMLCTIGNEADAEVVAMIRDSTIPTVLVDRSSELPVDTVAADHFNAAYQPTKYLLALGHRRIGMITVPQEVRTGRERIAGMARAYREIGLEPDPRLLATHGYSADYGYRTSYAFLTGAEPPTALVVGAAQMVGVLRAVRALGLRVPEQLSLITFGDTDLAEFYGPPLTAVRWSTAAVGQAAAETLLLRIAQGDGMPLVRLVLPTEVIVRGSCTPPRRR